MKQLSLATVTQGYAILRRALDLAHRCGALAPTERTRTELVAAGKRPRRARPQRARCFNAVLYAIDTVVPLVSLDQRSTWYPDPYTPDGSFMQWWLNMATLLGWLLSSIFVLSLARLPAVPDHSPHRTAAPGSRYAASDPNDPLIPAARVSRSWLRRRRRRSSSRVSGIPTDRHRRAE